MDSPPARIDTDATEPARSCDRNDLTYDQRASAATAAARQMAATLRRRR